MARSISLAGGRADTVSDGAAFGQRESMPKNNTASHFAY
jgi:hypothetical protein